MLMYLHDESFIYLCFMHLILLFMNVMIKPAAVHLPVDPLSENKAESRT